MFDIFTWEFDVTDAAVSSSGLYGCECVRADLGCGGASDAIPGVAEFVFGVFVNLLAAFRVVVVEDFFGAEGFVEGEVFGGCCAYDFVS
jgi:hypothetical protein